MKKSTLKLIVYNAFAFLILGLVVSINAAANHWNRALDLYLGKIGGAGANASASDYSSDEDLRLAQEELVRNIVDEGSVLLRNENNALPLAGNEKVTIFGQQSVFWANGSIGSAAMKSKENMTLKQSLEASGFTVNSSTWDYYVQQNKKIGAGGGGQSSDWSLNETPWDTIKSSCGSSFASNKDIAVVLFTRLGCEGGDLPREMSRYDGAANESYLQLSSTEKGLLEGIKSEGFSKIVLILKTSNVIQMDFIDEAKYGVDACLLIGSTGANGIEEIGKILNGSVNPSGHLADTIVYDNFSSPAMQNFGDFRYVDSNGEVIKANFLNYSEGIYVGYKYYETRYEDKVLNTSNVGNYDYSTQVKYPFGYGLSYTNFEYSDSQMSEQDGKITVTTNVKNTGTVEGKDAVEVYFQAPYTEYDKTNKVEKASVNLVAFKKTGSIKPGESEAVEITFDLDDMKSYDYTNKKCYIMDEGNYYISIGNDAHDALNNILAKKGKGVADGMTQDGVANNAFVYSLDSFKEINKDDATEHEITNRFDDAIAADGKYLSRSKWTMMEDNGLCYATGEKEGVSFVTDANRTVKTRLASDELIAKLDDISFQSSGIPQDKINNSDVVFEQNNKVKFSQLKGLEYGSDMYKKFVQQLKISELHSLYNTAGYGTKGFQAYGMPTTYHYDGPLGLTSYVSDWSSFSYPNITMIASTYNVELAEKMGKLVAEDGLRANVSGWYAPAMNIHRTAFSGRNYEYYSEDGILSGIIGAAEVKGANSKGMITFIKHFAANDEETERSSCSIWLNEQSFREIYLKPFEITVKEGKTTGLMASMNRIGTRYTRGSYALMTQILRDEWGFKGATITDFTATNKKYADMALAAGIDLQLDTTPNVLTSTKENYIRNALQQAAERTCYMIANSNAMDVFNGGGSSLNEGISVWVIIVLSLDAVAVIGLGLGEFFMLRDLRRNKKSEQLLED